MPTPPWTVIGVFDPEGTQTDFSYTVGLHLLGRPELHLPARPTDGADPGADWALSYRDRGHLLNELGTALAEGGIGPGTVLPRDVDGGAATMTLTLGEPGDPAAVDAFQVADGARVIPIRWTLHRAPEGPPTPLDAPATARFTQELTALAARPPDYPDRVAALPPVWRPDAVPDFSPDAPFGPLTPYVRALAAQLAGSGPDGWDDFLQATLLAEQERPVTSVVLARTAALARPWGRTAALSALQAALPEFVAALRGPDGRAPAWQALLDLARPDLDGPERDRLEKDLHRLFHQSVGALLSTAALADVADEDLLRAGLGPAAWAAHGTLPHPRWAAPAALLARVTTALHGAGPQDLAAIADAHRDVGQVDPAYLDLVGQLRGAAITTPVNPPPAATLLQLDPDALAWLEDNLLIGELEDALTSVTAALALPAPPPALSRLAMALAPAWEPLGALLRPPGAQG